MTIITLTLARYNAQRVDTSVAAITLARCALEIITADYRALILNEGTINVLTLLQ